MQEVIGQTLVCMCVRVCVCEWMRCIGVRMDMYCMCVYVCVCMYVCVRARTYNRTIKRERLFDNTVDKPTAPTSVKLAFPLN